MPFRTLDTHPKAMEEEDRRTPEAPLSRAVPRTALFQHSGIRPSASRFFWVRLSLCAALAFVLGTSAARANEELEQSWSEFMQGLANAQESLTDPEDFPPEPTDRNLSEGYRYLLAHLGRMIEMELRQDPRYPEFNRSVDMLRKWTGENPDAMYLKAPVDGTGYYRVTGRVPNAQEWRTSERGLPGPKAPRLVTFQTITAIPGTTGELAEMSSCKNQTLDFVNSFDLSLGADGHFEILIGPERPADYRGNFLLSRKSLPCPGTEKEALKEARWLSVREIFSDWEQETTLEMEIVRLDAIGENRPPMTAKLMSEKLKTIATKLPNQIRFWQLVQELALEVRRDANGDGRRPAPVNGINQPALPFTAGGVAGAQQLYASGVFELAEDEALVVKVTAPVEPHYIGFQLNNFWFEGPDQQNYTSSLSGHQLPVSSDGSRYYIIAHKDPGVQGWVDTTGLEKGLHAMRFVFRENPPAEQMPRAEATLTQLEALGDLLPEDTPKVSPEERRREIAARQSHIKMRWRGH